jgi:predicted nucleic acid-binding protein
MIFCDTSYAAKLYLAEPGSAAVQPVLETEDEVCLSELARIELMAVFHRRLREGTLARPDFETVVRQFNRDDIGGCWTWLPLEAAIVEAASRTYATLPATLFLRSADCLHLVTAMHHNFSQIHTFDLHQAKAAPIFGLEAINLAHGE